MLFSSTTFLFVFLPVVCAGYFFLHERFRNHWLLLASLLFYGWGEPRYVSVMLLVIGLNYVAGIWMTDHPTYRKLILGLDVAINLSILIFFKYTDFLIENINAAIHVGLSPLQVIMPIGISFFIFQAISYAVDVYRGNATCQRNIEKLALYVSLFPQLVAGPIVKYQDVAKYIEDRHIKVADVVYGLRRFIIGLSKKVLIANTMGSIADSVYATGTAHMTWDIAWIGAIAYSLQIFFDFSGYSDMAIGLGRIFGFRFKENFNYPYIVASMTDFWRRWHMSLSSWFKEYLYIPLGGNRISAGRTTFNLFCVFLATGIWHGASWNFVAWGLWHGFFIILEKRCKGLHFPALLGHAYVILVFVLGWVLFRADDLSMAKDHMAVMFGLRQGIASFGLDYYVDGKGLLMGAIGILFCHPWSFEKWKNRPVLSWVYHGGLLLLLELSIIYIAASTYNPFIYFRF